MTSQHDLRKGFRIHFLSFLIGAPLTWIIWYVTGTSYPWPIWSTVGWAIGVLFHFLGAFVFKKSAHLNEY